MPTQELTKTPARVGNPTDMVHLAPPGATVARCGTPYPSRKGTAPNCVVCIDIALALGTYPHSRFPLS